MDLIAVGRRLLTVPGVVGSAVTVGDSPGSDAEPGGLIVYHRQLGADGHFQIQRIIDEATLVSTASAWVLRPKSPDWQGHDCDQLHHRAERAAAGLVRFDLHIGRGRLIPDFQPLAELATGHILADPSGELRFIRHRLTPYPPRLGIALAARLWEVGLLLADARRAADRDDTGAVAAALCRGLDLSAHALHGHAHRWPVDDLIAATLHLPDAPSGFANAAREIVATLGYRSDTLHLAIDDATDLVSAVAAVCEAARPPR